MHGFFFWFTFHELVFCTFHEIHSVVAAMKRIYLVKHIRADVIKFKLCAAIVVVYLDYVYERHLGWNVMFVLIFMNPGSSQSNANRIALSHTIWSLFIWAILRLSWFYFFSHRLWMLQSIAYALLKYACIIIESICNRIQFPISIIQNRYFEKK